jgi:hypothetical protein
MPVINYALCSEKDHLDALFQVYPGITHPRAPISKQTPDRIPHYIPALTLQPVVYSAHLSQSVS